MRGSLALVGSGEYLPAMAEFEKSLITDGMSNGMKPTYIQIPTAAGRESSNRLEHWRQLGKAQADLLGVTQLFLPIYSREGANNLEFANQIKDAALIYISGGDPHYLADSLIDTPVWSAIYANWQNGGSLAGCSAGAMVFSSQVPHFRVSRKKPTPGLNLISNIRVIPHFNKFFKWIPAGTAKIFINLEQDVILIGIDELTAIIKRTGQDKWQVYGQAQLHILRGLPERQLTHGEVIKF
jgi:cyanophycinase-like exopeptidase